MKTGWMIAAALPLVAATALAAGTQGSSKNSGLKRVVEDTRDDHDAFDRGTWQKKLASSDLAEREKAFEELAKLARRDDDAKKAVEDWANDEKDPELAWTGRLLRREIHRRGGPAGFGAFGRGFGAGGQGGSSSGGHGPMVFRMDPYGGFDWEDFSRRFDDLDSMFGDLRQEWGDMLKNLPSTSGGNGKSSAKSFSLQSSPDGVSCTVTENVDGKEEKHTYEAKSMDELLEEHPELRENLGNFSFHSFHGGPQGGLFLGPQGRFDVFPRGDQLRGLHVEDGTDANGNPRTDRLGISCSTIQEDRAKELGLESGVGLEVQEVVPGSIASVLGLNQGDVVTEINGTPIHSAEDVKKVLADRATGAAVAVVVVGEDGNHRTLTWKPKSSDKKSAEKSSSKDPGTKRGSREL